LLSEQLQRVRLPAPAYALRLVTLETEPFCPPTANLLAPHRAGGKPMEPLHQFIEKISARLGPQAIQRIRLQADYRPEAQHAAHEAGGNAGSNVGGNASGNSGSAVSTSVSNTLSNPLSNTHRSAARSSSRGSQGNTNPPRKKSSNPNKPAPPAIHPLAAFLPTWLLPTPLKLPMDGDFPAYRGALQLLHGPQRLETSTLVDAAAAPDSAVARDYFMAWNAQAGLVWVYRERATAGAAWYLHGLYA
jgi:protein ImuB